MAAGRGLRKGLQRKSFFAAERGKKDWSGKPGFFTGGTPVKKCAQIFLQLLTTHFYLLTFFPLAILP
jgi:hypothetical protein